MPAVPTVRHRFERRSAARPVPGGVDDDRVLPASARTTAFARY